MDLRFTDEEEAFRGELRAWLAEVLPDVAPEPDRFDWPARRTWDTDWQRRLYDAGYAGINWPKEYGGRGATPAEHLIFLEETERARAPYVGHNFVGLLHAGPTLIAEATPEQKAYHLPGILSGEHVWCQGFSEPSAGSDLASLRTRAMRDGDDYVISGQKIWTSFGHTADYCEMLVRTDPDVPKHRGISWLICPMDLDGHRHPPAADDGGLDRVLRGLLRRGARARRQPGRRRERRLAGHDGDPQLRARHGVHLRTARGDRAGQRFGRARRRRSSARPGRRSGTTAACAARSASSPPSSTRCGR